MYCSTLSCKSSQVGQHLIQLSAKLGASVLLNYWPNGQATGSYYQIQIEDISTDLQLEVLLVKK